MNIFSAFWIVAWGAVITNGSGVDDQSDESSRSLRGLGSWPWPTPSWWYMVEGLNYPNLNTCGWRQNNPPKTGDYCDNNTDWTCFFRPQKCGWFDFPSSLCMCRDVAGARKWTCEDVSCPGDPEWWDEVKDLPYPNIDQCLNRQLTPPVTGSTCAGRGGTNCFFETQMCANEGSPDQSFPSKRCECNESTMEWECSPLQCPTSPPTPTQVPTPAPTFVPEASVRVDRLTLCFEVPGYSETQNSREASIALESTIDRYFTDFLLGYYQQVPNITFIRAEGNSEGRYSSYRDWWAEKCPEESNLAMHYINIDFIFRADSSPLPKEHELYPILRDSDLNDYRDNYLKTDPDLSFLSSVLKVVLVRAVNWYRDIPSTQPSIEGTPLPSVGPTELRFPTRAPTPSYRPSQGPPSWFPIWVDSDPPVPSKYPTSGGISDSYQAGFAFSIPNLQSNPSTTAFNQVVVLIRSLVDDSDPGISSFEIYLPRSPACSATINTTAGFQYGHPAERFNVYMEVGLWISSSVEKSYAYLLDIEESALLNALQSQGPSPFSATNETKVFGVLPEC